MSEETRKEEVITEAEPKKGRPKKEIDYSKITFAEADREQSRINESKANHEAMRLVRCRITCNNTNKQNYQGEIFCVRNKNLPEVKKMVPFNKITHVPQILLNMIKEKQYQKFKEERQDNGAKMVKPYLINEYNVEILDPITPEEFEAIKQHQLAEGSVKSGD